MPYTVTVSSRIFSSDDLQSLRTDFKLPATEFRSISPIQLPSVISLSMDENSSYVVDFTQFGTKLRLFALKSSRPVSLSMTDGTETYNYPMMTYFQHHLDSAEDVATTVTSLTITVPAAPLIQPTIVPPRYPKATVELFALFE